MGNWKVLGEVPDSDDEALYSHESRAESQTRDESVTGLAGQDEPGESADDIRRVPHPSPHKNDHHTLTSVSPPCQPAEADRELPIPTTLPSFEALDVDSDDEVDIICEDVPDIAALESSPFPATPRAVRIQRSQQSPADRTVEPVTALLQPPSSPLSSLSSVSSLSDLASPPPKLPTADHIRESSPSPLPLLPDSPPIFRLGFVRSLRRRKPIQEHPYLLEDARYARVMKAHGLKPVRTTYNTTQDGDPAQEESQEKEFAVGASQGPDRINSIPAEDTQIELQNSPVGLGEVVRWTPSPRTSTPARQLFPSSRGSVEERTDGTSLSDEDEFPSPKTFVRRRRQRLHAEGLAQDDTRRKQSRAVDPALRDAPKSPRWIPVRVELSPASSPEHHTGPHREVRDTVPSVAGYFPSGTRDNSVSNVVDVEDLEGEAFYEALGSAPEEDAEEGQNGSEGARRIGRRIPASWLILEQRRTASNTERPPAVSRRAGLQNVDPSRKGVALPKRHSPGTAATTDFMFDDSDDDVEIIGDRPQVIEAVSWLEESLDEAEGERREANHVANNFGDLGSDMEEEIIDRMTSGTKRRTYRKGGHSKKRQKTGSSLFKGTPGQKTRQPKITRMLGRSQAPASSVGSDRHFQRTHSAPQRHLSKPTAGRSRALLPPPLLSILDLVEPAAPDFIRIAARTARSRPKLGKTSPSRKAINLGSRGDNVDALSVLHDWKSGKIRPRIQSAPRVARQPKKPQPLEEVSLKYTRRGAHKPKEVTTTRVPSEGSLQHDGNNSSATGLSRRVTETQKQATSTTQNGKSTARPAQLETLSQNRLGRSYFISKKKELDEMYRRRRKDAHMLPNVRLERFIDGSASVDNGITDDGNDFQDDVHFMDIDPRSAIGKKSQNAYSCQSRFRKRDAPKLVDTTAPRFVHALDPIPLELGPVMEAQPTCCTEIKTDKLLGLGLFGSQYSQHFDVFPLDGGIFLGRGTLLGSGRLSTAIGTDPTDELHSRYAKVFEFQLDGRNLTWTVWDDNASSEFGILLDWLADILHPNNTTPESQTGQNVSEAVNFVLDFIQRVISVSDVSEETQHSFIMRSFDVLSSFAGRLDAATSQHEIRATDRGIKNNLVALSGTVLMAIWMLRICRDSPTCLAVSFDVEELLKRIAKISIRLLLKCGLESIRSAYDDFQQPLFQGREIRGDMQTLVSWAILMQSLGYARIPKAGFWDMTYSVMLDGSSLRTCTDAKYMERMWEAMFTLLPLGEFDSFGVVQSGLRHLVSLDGWTLPREALNRVFQVYKENTRQSPSFNAYCRALLGRCHLLVKEWGWQRCSSIVGVIFDFFGQQDFAHLRNEEAHASPRFLEELADSPSLDLTPDDKCFHIFIKMLGLVILRLRRLDLTNELRNLITRTLPNHNRQYLKEQDIHSGELAALRNHHDLLCTLFWAAPPELRPGVHLIEKLVMPGSSHKEACIINIRAWNQLARFVVANGEDYNIYKGFASWMNSIFQQVLEQFLSVEADMQKQLLRLSENMMLGISPHIVKAMAAKNRAASLDVLHMCITASLDVLKHTKSLEMATYCFSSIQLEAIFTKIDLQLSGSDWGVLQTALDTVSHYLDRVEKAMDEQYSSSLDDVDAHATEEAVMMLDHKLAKSLFHLNSSVTRMPLDGTCLASRSRVDCTEKCVALSARLASRFIHSGVYRLSLFFGSGDRSLFERLPHAPGLAQRKFLPLFLAAMVQNNVFDFKDIGSSILELWLLAIVKPERFLAYEIRLAETLKRHDVPYLRKAFVPTNGQLPSYDTNRAFFACALSSMRLSLQEAEAARRQQLRSDFARALKLVMRQMKEDLNYGKAEAAPHEKYVGFVRCIVALIKSHGGDICPLDDFFYQQSQDYSPSVEDPQLQTAGIIAYGLRLGEGEATAAPQLFHYLHNNFNIALANNQLGKECEILERGMDNNEVLRFVLERLLPAIIRATGDTCDAWPMLAVYCSALQSLLTRWDVPKDIGDENMAAAIGVMDEILNWLRGNWRGGSSLSADTGGTRMLSCVQVHVMALLTALANVLQPVLMTCSYLALSPSTSTGLDRVVREFHSFATRSSDMLKRRANSGEGLASRGGERGGSIPLSVVLGDDGEGSGFSGRRGSMDGYETGLDSVPGTAQVNMFRKLIVRHVRENWVVGDGQISVRKASARAGGAGDGSVNSGAAAATVVAAGTAYGPWTMGELLDELQRQRGRPLAQALIGASEPVTGSLLGHVSGSAAVGKKAQSPPTSHFSGPFSRRYLLSFHLGQPSSLFDLEVAIAVGLLMDRKRSRDPDDETSSPSGKRMRQEVKAGADALFATSNNAMQAVAHEALAISHGGGGFSAINSANRKIVPSSTAIAIATATTTATVTATVNGDSKGNGNMNGNEDSNGNITGNSIGNDSSVNRLSFESMSDITRSFKNAVDKAWDCRSPTYAGVHVLLIYWDEDDEAVKDAAAQLESVFRTTYHFDTDIFSIQSAVSCDMLYAKVETFFASNSSPGDLAILYYAGEIEANRLVGEAPVWTPRGQIGTASIESKPIQAACESASCDVLLLFDFCNAYHYPLTKASYGTARRNVVEVLDAPTFDLDSSSISFTMALAEELSADALGGPISVEAIKVQVSDRMTVSKPRGRGRPPKDPQAKPPCDQLHLPKHYFLFQRRSIVLTPLPAEPQIILCLRVRGILDVNEWGKWIYNAAPEARDAVKIEGLHSGFSTIIVLRVPVSEWSLFSECPAGSFVGYTTVGDIDSGTLEKIDKDLASKLWFEEAPPTRIQPPEALTPVPIIDATDPGIATTTSIPRAVGSASPATPVDGDMDSTFTSRTGQKRARKALPTERKILPSEPSPASLRKREYAPGDERKAKDYQLPHHGQIYSQQKQHGHAVDDGGLAENNVLLAAAQKPFKISIKLAGQTHVCKECKAGFKDGDSLQNHVRKLHTRPFHCVFHWAGCESTFASKNEWKRHVMSQHILLQYWVCQVEMCSKVINKVNGTGGNGGSNTALDSTSGGGSGFSLPNGAIFNRKDLFTQHLRRMHTPPHVKKLLKQAKQGAKMPNHASIIEWENRLKDLQQDGLKPRCRLPDYMVCPAQGCGIDFHGNNAWDDRMEHVARHLEAASAGREPPVVFGGKTDTTLTNWATRLEVGIAKRVGPDTWHLDNPLRPEIVAWMEDVHNHEQPGVVQTNAGREMEPPIRRERSRSVIEVAEEGGRHDPSGRRVEQRESGAGVIPVN
ncbi:hmg-i/hmg-y, DNA-binding protein [Grosmannia clavigera kw1407]|uniref:Hmg-i/hmg-y, DNA-binding protein n=1 Tax=Grosmannia clavigera (strain kw1407 / UAMH 11150) TaxID=655863 RepID=F0XTE7_GROCL|nr:hmg-i/hmg-y, DNA-binding protein [Grosmannia clavigera kw1407]EFW99010.1 hmg-i/hmg-y, DNA-binding protein [Grosmannia clavigera kw1407]